MRVNMGLIFIPVATNQIWAGAPNQCSDSQKNESLLFNSPD